MRRARLPKGKVLTAAGEPAVGATVLTSSKYRPYAWKFPDPNDYHFAESVTTDASGRFEIRADQQATMAITRRDQAPLLVDDLSDVPSGTKQEPHVYKMPNGISVRGRVVDANDQSAL